MRKTSQDGGDSTSITSGVENEMKKPMVGLLKTKKTSFKRRVQNFSHESDDAVIEPLLQKDKDKTEMPNQSAKHNILSKAKTESLSEVINDKDKLLPDKKNEKSLISAPSAVAGASSFINGTKEDRLAKLHENSANTIHNHMNTNIFSSLDGGKSIFSPKTQILVEIDGGKQSSYNPSPLIFTTAKIHTDGKTNHMEPVQVTPVPILSTIEGSVIKSGNICDNNKVSSGASNKGDILHTIYVKSNAIDSKVANEQQYAKNSPAYSNLTCSGMPSRIKDENKEQNTLIQHSAPSSKSNDVSSSVVTVDVNITLPAKTIKSETGMIANSLTKIVDKSEIDKSDRASKSAVIKDSFMSNGNKIDINKNIQPLCTSSLEKVSSDKVAMDSKVVTDITGNKQLQRQKQAIGEDNDKDMTDSYFNSGKLHKDTINSSHQKLQQDTGASKSVVDLNKPILKVNTNITPTSNVTSKSAIKSLAIETSPLTTNMIVKPTTATLASTTKAITTSSVLTSSSGKSIEESVNPIIKATSSAASTSLVNKLVSTVPSLAKTTISASKSIGKSASTKTSTIKPEKVAVSTSTNKKISEKNVSNPLSTTSVTNKSSVTTATSTVKPLVTTTSLISTAKPAVSITTVIPTKPVVITTSSSAETSATKSGYTAKPTVSSSESTVKTIETIPIVSSQTMTATLSSASKPVVTTVKSPFITSNSITSKTPITSADKPNIATTISTSCSISTPPVTKSSNTTTSKTDLATKSSEKSKSITTPQSSAKTVANLASNTFKPVITSSSTATHTPIAKLQENLNQSTLSKSSKISASKPTTVNPMQSSSVSSKSPITSTSTTSTSTNSVKQSTVKSSTPKLNSSTVPKFHQN